MERRNFVVGFMAFVGSIKAIFGKSDAQLIAPSKSAILKLSEIALEKDKTIHLTSSMVIELPKNPETIETIYQFSVAKSRFGKSPIILTNGEKLNGVELDSINVKKDIKLHHSPLFYLQYTGKDIGWIYLS